MNAYLAGDFTSVPERHDHVLAGSFQPAPTPPAVRNPGGKGNGGNNGGSTGGGNNTGGGDTDGTGSVPTDNPTTAAHRRRR